MDEPDGIASRFSRPRAWSAVALLTIVGMVNLIDRTLPGLLVEPIKHDLALSDTAMGIITGFAFVIVYSLMGIPIARIADRGAYGAVISACLALWSLMTLVGALAQTGLQLGLSRMGVALGEAGSTPAAHAFIARNFAPNERAAPLSVLTLSIPLAGVLANIGGSMLAVQVGWRMTFAVMGVAGLVLAPAVLLLLTPRQRLSLVAVRQQASLREGFAILRKSSVVLIFLASAFVGISGYAIQVFAPAFLMRTHGMTLGEMGVKLGLTAGIMGIVGVLGAGFLADRLARHDTRWSLWVVAAMLGGLLPCSIAAFLVRDSTVSLVLLAISTLMSTAYLPPVVASIQRLVLPEMRAVASAMLLLFTAVAGGAGPLLTGMISDALEPELGPRALGKAMLIVPAAQAVACLLYLAASTRFRGQLVSEAAENPAVSAADQSGLPPAAAGLRSPPNISTS